MCLTIFCLQEEADPDEEPEGMGDMDIPGGGARRFKEREEGEYGSGAGVIEDVEPGVERLRKGVGGGRLVFQGSRGGSRGSSRPGSGHGSSGSSGEQRGMQRTPSPADELLRSQMLSKQTIPHSPSSKRKGASTPRGREALSSAGSMRSAKFEDLEGMEFGSDVWASEAGIKIGMRDTDFFPIFPSLTSLLPWRDISSLSIPRFGHTLSS